MIRALRLNDFGVREAKRHAALVGKKMIGRGVFSAVFEGSRPDTVLKMTVDSSNYWMLNCSVTRVKGVHFPKVIHNYGPIGMANVAGEKCSIYLFEIERLAKLEKGSSAKQIAGHISRRQNSIHGSAAESLGRLLSKIDVPKSVHRAIKALQDWAHYYPESYIDMHAGNFMQRPSGELVITDPVMNWPMYSAVLSR